MPTRASHSNSTWTVKNSVRLWILLFWLSPLPGSFFETLLVVKYITGCFSSAFFSRIWVLSNFLERKPFYLEIAESQGFTPKDNAFEDRILTPKTEGLKERRKARIHDRFMFHPPIWRPIHKRYHERADKKQPWDCRCADIHWRGIAWEHRCNRAHSWRESQSICALPDQTQRHLEFLQKVRG